MHSGSMLLLQEYSYVTKLLTIFLFFENGQAMHQSIR